MSWKPEYEENRKLREAANPELREKRLLSAKLSQDRNREFRKKYMAEYYAKHPEKFGRRTPEQRERYNEKRRAEYKTNPQLRQKVLADTKAWQTKNPEKRHAQRVKKYGMTPQQVLEIMNRQSHACAICGWTERKPKMFPMIDHCHATGKVRGILCSDCNMGLGKFKDSPARLQSAITYLQSNG